MNLKKLFESLTFSRKPKTDATPIKKYQTWGKRCFVIAETKDNKSE